MKIKKIIAFVSLFFLLVSNVQAFFGKGISSGDVSMAADTLEQRYGFDSNILRRASQSNTGTGVSINFDNPTPQEGEEVTAIAIVEKYENPVEKLYFTWFLLRAEDDLQKSETIEKAKRRAAKIMAQGKFNPVYFATDYSTNRFVDADKDYFKAPFGGGNGVGGREGDETKYAGIGKYEEESYIDKAKRVVDSTKITRCYRHNYGYSFEEEEEEKEGTSGKDLVIECKHQFPVVDENGPESVSEFCDSGESEYILGTGNSQEGFTADKEACWSLDPNNPDTDGDGVPDEADLIGMGQDKFKWKYKNGDRVGLIVEGMTSIVINEEGKADDWEEMTLEERQKECEAEKAKCDDDCRKAVGIEDDQTTTTGTIDPATGEVNITSETKSGEDPLAIQDYQICKEECIKKYDKCMQEAQGYVDYINQQRQIEAESKAINGYRKIMWTGIDICTKDKIDLMANDECDSEDDIGFSFWASKLVKEKAAENLETKVTIFPETPQISTVDENSSDFVTLTAEITNENTDGNFAYYKWDFYACGEEGLESCLKDENLITGSCIEGSSLGECALIDKDGDGVAETPVLNSSSSAEGMGVSEISFQPKNDLLPSEKSYLKVLIKTKRDKSKEQYSVTEVDVPFTKSNTGIRLFKISENSDGSFGFNEKEDEICNKKETGVDDGYSVMCPVFPYQIVAGKSAIKEGMNEDKFSYAWQVDGKNLTPINNCPFQNGCNQDIVYFVVTGEDLERKVITLKAKEESLNNSTAQKIYSVNSPLGLIKLDSEDPNAAWAKIKSDGTTAEDLFEVVAGKEVSFRADLIPNYLNQNGDEDVDILWILNGEEVNKEYFEQYPDSGVTLEEGGKKINFSVPEKVGSKISLKLIVKKSFFAEEDDTDEEKVKKERERKLLEETFGILNYRDSESTRVAEISVVTEPVTAMEKGSLKLFFASTIKNAPEYLIFSMRLAIMLILSWALLFGFSYFSDFKSKDNFWQ